MYKKLRFWLFLVVFPIYLISQLISPIAPTIAQTAVNCPDVGKDGGGTISGIVNTYYQPASSSTLNAGQTTINLGTLSPIGATIPVSVGDLILIMQMQGADANYTNTSAYGNGVGGDVGGYEPPTAYPNGSGASSSIASPSSTAGSGYTNLNNTGLYEYAIVTAVSGSSITIQGAGTGGGLLNTYINAPATSTHGKRTYQIIRVPQYSNITVSSATPLVPSVWNGQVGGVLAIDVAGTLTMTGGVVMEASGRGFRGGASRRLTGGAGINTDFRTLSTINNNGSKAEGIAGTPRYVLNYFDPFTLDAAFNPTTVTLTDTLVEGYPDGSHGRGAPGNAGGGSTDGRPNSNDQNSGGGGGGNGGSGGMGGRAWSSQTPTGGFGGIAIPTSAINNGQRLFMGGGGGGGTTNDSSRSSSRPTFPFTSNSQTLTGGGIYSSGGAGGGIIMVRTGNISGSGTFRSRGAVGLSSGQDGAGGGGAGGTVYVVAVNTTNIANISADVRGGDGGWSTFNAAHGPGGGGGGGVVVSTLPGVTIASLAGGQAGKTGANGNADAVNGTHGAFAGTGLTTNIQQTGNYGTPPTATCRAQVLLVKRITALNGSNASLTSFIDETNPANNPADDNSPSWIPSYLRGGGTTNPGDPFNNGTLQVKPGDTLDYTIYFVNAGGNRANGVRICDPIPPNTEFVPDTYNPLSPKDGGLPADSGIALAIGSSTPTAYLTNINDPPDRGRYYPPGDIPANCFDTLGSPITSNPNGVVAVDITRTTGSPTFPNLPANTIVNPSTTNYGFVRFRVRVK